MILKDIVDEILEDVTVGLAEAIEAQGFWAKTGGNSEKYFDIYKDIYKAIHTTISVRLTPATITDVVMARNIELIEKNQNLKADLRRADRISSEAQKNIKRLIREGVWDQEAIDSVPVDLMAMRQAIVTDNMKRPLCEIAEKIGVSPPTLKNIITGKNAFPSKDTAKKIRAWMRAEEC